MLLQVEARDEVIDAQQARARQPDSSGIELEPSGARVLLERLAKLVAQVDAEAPLPYNLLVTWDWMFLLPRTRGFFHGIEVNSLGFAGTLLARDQEQLAFIKREGPMTLLRNVAFPSE